MLREGCSRLYTGPVRQSIVINLLPTLEGGQWRNPNLNATSALIAIWPYGSLKFLSHMREG